MASLRCLFWLLWITVLTFSTPIEPPAPPTSPPDVDYSVLDVVTVRPATHPELEHVLGRFVGEKKQVPGIPAERYEVLPGAGTYADGKFCINGQDKYSAEEAKLALDYFDKVRSRSFRAFQFP
jgi:hypothetical protein